MEDKATPTGLQATTLTGALILARKDLRGSLHKDAYNQHQKYHYLGHETVNEHVRPILLRHGLLLEERRVTFKESVEGKSPVLVWEGEFTLSHVSGEVRDYKFSATTMVTDKAAFVASTALDRTAQLRVMALSGSAEEDPENDYHDRRDREEQQRPLDRTATGQTQQRSTSGPTSTGVGNGGRTKESLARELREIEAAKLGDVGAREALIAWAEDWGSFPTNDNKAAGWGEWARVCATYKLNPNELSQIAAKNVQARNQGAGK
jgi:hypothetical protein